VFWGSPSQAGRDTDVWGPLPFGQELYTEVDSSGSEGRNLRADQPTRARKIVQREVTEVLTPGTVLDEDFLDSKEEKLCPGLFGSAR
jgi:hypothetical protein